MQCRDTAFGVCKLHSGTAQSSAAICPLEGQLRSQPQARPGTTPGSLTSEPFGRSWVWAFLSRAGSGMSYPCSRARGAVQVDTHPKEVEPSWPGGFVGGLFV